MGFLQAAYTVLKNLNDSQRLLSNMVCSNSRQQCLKGHPSQKVMSKEAHPCNSLLYVRLDVNFGGQARQVVHCHQALHFLRDLLLLCPLKLHSKPHIEFWLMQTRH